MRLLRYVFVVCVVVTAALWFNNTSLWSPGGQPLLLAHRGLAQTYQTRGLDAQTCTASRIHPPEHRYIENTIASMAAAYEAGADIVEFDIHPTTDKQFAVFHDWTLDCRTDGHGVTREASMADLRKLDLGHGYTSDGGKTYPFRGEFVGHMPTMDEVLTRFPDKRFLIHVKSNDPKEGELLADRLMALPTPRLRQLIVYGGNAPINVLRQRMPGLRTASRNTMKQCATQYLTLSWSGHVPADCANTMIMLPTNYGRWAWGWPNLLVARLKSVNTEVFVIGANAGEDFSSGIDSPVDALQIPQGFAGGIWTNRIDRIAPLFAARK